MSEIVTKCPVFNELECSECKMKDYIGDRCLLFSAVDAMFLLVKEVKELKEAIKRSERQNDSFNQLFEDAVSFRDKMLKRAALEHGRCREADQLTDGDDLPF